MGLIIGQAAVSVFIAGAEQLAADIAKQIGLQVLPGIIIGLQNAEKKLGSPSIIQFRKSVEKGIEQGLLDLAEEAWKWCTEGTNLQGTLPSVNLPPQPASTS